MGHSFIQHFRLQSDIVLCVCFYSVTGNSNYCATTDTVLITPMFKFDGLPWVLLAPAPVPYNVEYSIQNNINVRNVQTRGHITDNCFICKAFF